MRGSIRLRARSREPTTAVVGGDHFGERTGPLRDDIAPTMPAVRPAEHLVFYGTLMSAFDTLDELGIRERLRLVGTCTLAGRLYDMGEWPSLMLGGGIVHGELFEVLDAGVFVALDPFEECYPADPLRSRYRREIVALLGAHHPCLGVHRQRAGTPRRPDPVGILARTGRAEADSLSGRAESRARGENGDARQGHVEHRGHPWLHRADQLPGKRPRNVDLFRNVQGRWPPVKVLHKPTGKNTYSARIAVRRARPTTSRCTWCSPARAKRQRRRSTRRWRAAPSAMPDASPAEDGGNGAGDGLWGPSPPPLCKRRSRR